MCITGYRTDADEFKNVMERIKDSMQQLEEYKHLQECRESVDKLKGIVDQFHLG